MDTDLSRVITEWQRIDPKFREAYASEGAGIVTIDIADNAIAGALRALSALPDDAGAAAMRAALGPFREPRPQNDTDCWFCESPSTSDHPNVTSSSLNAAICEQCARRALNDGEPVSEAEHTVRAAAAFCSLCRGGPQPVGTEVYRGRFAFLCPSCAKLAVEIFDEERETRTRSQEE